MKRIHEKIKDLVEVRPYKSLQDFIIEPMQTLSAYHFTDFTADMMAKWIDRVAEVQGQNGQAKALAGYRGVGKSHFLAALGAIISNPELRSRITDQYVATSAQRLKRKRYPVGYVRRGTYETLYDEIKVAVGSALEIDPLNLPNTLSEIMEFASQKAGEVPFVIFIDTAFDRESRVSRDDGQTLDELAEIAKRLNVFVGVALDDDIAGADGANAAIASSYTIDYLDQEHLYRIIETHLLPKNRQTQLLLHEIYMGFREVLSNFRWSEQRFTALYPLHPIILEVAPYIRLYDKSFTILNFAAQAGTKVLSRPANSLVGLDEVFDSVENSLRKSKDLKDAFATYDKLNTEVVSSVPIMQRLHAKLVLKALLVLSLNGDGTTAAEICSAMLIYNENDPPSSIKSVEELLEKFYAADNEAISCVNNNGRETRYGFRISEKDNLNLALAKESERVSANVTEKILRRFAKERFSDWSLQVENETSAVDISDCQIVWRGGLRRGKVVWNWSCQEGEKLLDSNRNIDFLDWEVIICHSDTQNLPAFPTTEVPVVFWKPASIRADEVEILRRYFVLLTNTKLREQFGEQVRATGHTYHNSVERIWRRLFIDEGKLLIDSVEYPFSENSKQAGSLDDLFCEMLKPLFELRYQQHPNFEKTLGMGEVSQIVSEHFSGARDMLTEVQQLAKDFALPLGLVFEQNGQYILETDEKLVNKTYAKEVMDLVSQNSSENISLKSVYKTLKGEPLGLPREAQHLVLSALVAQRRLEFITSKGDRISRRSLDLKIIWDDIVGISAPSSQIYSSAELTNWAKILTGVDTFQNIDNPNDYDLICNALEVWLTDWKNAQLLERFEKIADENLNIRIWKLAKHAENTFGAVADTVGSLLERTISLEETLQRVIDAFADSEEEYISCAKSLVVLEDFISGLALREKIWEYLALCESTKDAGIETLRAKLLMVLKKVTDNPSELLNRELENTWQAFLTRFSDYFAVKHDIIMKSHLLQEKFDLIMRSDEWWEFENLSLLPIFHKHYWNKAQSLCQQFNELDCGFDVKEMLKLHPFCACSFNLSQISEWESLHLQLAKVIKKGRDSYRNTLRIMKQNLVSGLKEFIQNNKEIEFRTAAANLIAIMEEQESFRLLRNSELIVLSKVIQLMSNSPLLNVNLPTELNFQDREELQKQLDDWAISPYLLKI